MRAGLLRMIGFLPVALVVAQPVGAQEAGPASPKISDHVSMREAGPDDIVVTARPEPTPRQVDKQARAISRVNGSVLREPLGRFRSRVCPGVIGMPRDMGELMVGRIRYNAGRLGITLADESVCRANIVVAFVRNGKTEIEALAQTNPHLFGQLTTAERKELLAETGPAYVWTNTAVRSRHGDLMQGESSPAHSNPNNPPRLNVGNSHSHIFLAHRLDIESAVVIIDIAAVDGMSIDQIADYVTMRTFARTRPVDAEAAADSILSLFDPNGAPPRELTSFDLAYLKSLYDSYDSLRAVAVIGATAREARKTSADKAPAARTE